MGKKVSSFDKFVLLLWKNWLLQWNHKVKLIFELLLPVIFLLLFVLIRMLVTPNVIMEQIYLEVPISSLRLLRERNRNITLYSIGYSPKNPLIDAVVNKAASLLALRKVEGYKNAKEMEVGVLKGSFLAGIEFDDSLSTIKSYPKKITFKLRFPKELRTGMAGEIWETDRLFPLLLGGGPRNVEDIDGGIPCGYIREGFIPLQHAISMSYLELAGNVDLPNIVMRRFPYPNYYNDNFLFALQIFFPIILVLSFLSPCVYITRNVTLEKEQQLKEVMKIMGLESWIHWTAWFVKSLIMLTISCLTMLLLLKLKVNGDFSMLTYSNAFVLFLFLLFYSVVTISFCFMLAVFFSRANTAAAATGLIWFFSYFGYWIVNKRLHTMSMVEKTIWGLNLNIAMIYGVNIIFGFESTTEGVQLNNMFKTYSPDDDFTLGGVFILMLITAIIYMLICLYVEQIFPGAFGVPKKWNFPFKRKFWSRRQLENPEEIRDKPTVRENPDAFEAEPENKAIGVQIKGLTRKFGSKWAVKGVTTNLFMDEITVLLGHNGAGKTTMISMLTGMFPPTSGTAIINGCDIRTDIEGVRMSMGLCPQHNVLFDDLSVANHIVFFSRLKGVKGAAIKNEVSKYIKMIGLENKAQTASKNLSGGMKRKLSLCCAMCGGTKVILCDEPSSGLDPAARRQLWDLLQKEKKGRTVLLTTHFMDEADVLGDRVAIMCDGKLQCQGTTFFLKKKFGSGYSLICVKKESCNVAGVTSLLNGFIPGIQPESNIGTELVFRLPDSFSGVFGKMLSALENKSEELGLDGYGIGISSLEEVFMKVGAENISTEVGKEKVVEEIMAPKPREPKKNTEGDSEKEEDDVKTDELERFDDSSEKSGADNNNKRETKFEESELNKEEENGSRDGVAKNSIDGPKDKPTTEESFVYSSKEDGKKEGEKLMRFTGKSDGDESESEEIDKEEANKRKSTRKLNQPLADDEKSDKYKNDEEKEMLDELPATKLYPPGDEERGPGEDYDKLLENVKESKGTSLFISQWQAMFLKKMLYTWRNKLLFAIQCFVAIFLVILFVLMKLEPGEVDLPPMKIGLDQYKNAYVGLKKPESLEVNSVEGKIAKQYEKYVNSYGSGHTCEVVRGSSFERYILQLSAKNHRLVNIQYLAAATMTTGKITAWFNNQLLHTAPLSLNLIHNAMAKSVLGPTASIRVVNHPLPLSEEHRIEELSKNSSASGSVLTLLLCFCMSLITVFYILTLVRENVSRSKLLQFVAGVRVYTFWIVQFCWDLITFLVISLLMLILLVAFRVEGYSDFGQFVRHFVLFFVFALAALPITYFFAAYFTEPAAAFARISIVNIFTGMGLYMAYLTMSVKELRIGDIAESSLLIFRLFPHFSLAKAFHQFNVNYSTRQMCNSEFVRQLPKKQLCVFFPQCCDMVPYFDMKPPGVMMEIKYMLCVGLIVFLVVVLRDYKLMDSLFYGYKKSPKTIEDENRDGDVDDERERIEDMTKKEIAQHNLVLDRVSKYYGAFIAVNQISLCVKENECFGLLGVNGAGKTTTFKMMTGDERVSSGAAYIKGINLSTKLYVARKQIGYCPQFDALPEDLTGRETLRIFCLLKGIPKTRITSVSEELANSLGFMRHIDKPTRTYSGGNKRKLSAAIAIVGGPSVVFLDEPTSGMDPAARRRLWNVVCYVRDSGKSIVLTSHSMDECEALCTRLAIMVNGEFKCLGSLQHLKNKFSKGVILKLKVKQVDDNQTKSSKSANTNIELVKMRIFQQYPNANLKEEYQNLLSFHIPFKGSKWSEIFNFIEKNRVPLNIEDYTINQTTLEEIFLEFAKLQRYDSRGVHSKKACCGFC